MTSATERPFDMDRDRPVKVALVGAGYWGKNLVRNFHALGAAKFVLDDDPAAVARMLELHPGLAAAAGFGQILADPEVAGVVLATPAVTHYDLARQALLADKHVFVEKPLALTAGQGRELRDLAAGRRRTLMVDHILQNHPAYLKLRELLAAGALGRLRRLVSRRQSFGKIRLEEDVLWSFAPHDLSMILGLAGCEPETVRAIGDSWLTPGLADAVEARLDFKGGLSAHVSVSWLHPVKEQRLVAVGEERMAVFDDTLPWPEKLKIYTPRVAWTAQGPVAEPGGPAEAVPLEEAEPLRAQCRDFLAAAAGLKKPATDADEGLKVLTVLESLSESLKNNGSPRQVSAAGAAAEECFIHPTALVDAGVKIGPGSKIWHFTHVLAGSEVGEKCNLGQNVVIGPRVKVGRGVKIQNNVSVYEGVTLEDQVFCGPSMVFTNVINPRAAIERKLEYRPTLVRTGATIGANATIVCGHTLGAWCLIGAGAVVTGDVPDYALMVGAPARRKGWVCRCGVKLPERLVCPACGLIYRSAGDGRLELAPGAET
jgi:UDP-2-acetamido-3-amino-2,3-dideoxy-glucuronate N-acetyltransferase